MREDEQQQQDEWVHLASTESSADTEDAFHRLREAGIAFRIARPEVTYYRKVRAEPIRILVQERDFDRATKVLWGEPVGPAADP